MKNKIVNLILVLVLLFSLVGCATVEHKIDSVKVVDTYYKPAYVQLVWTGKYMSTISHPALYGIVVSYNGEEITVIDMDAYYEYKDRIGEEVLTSIDVKTRKNGKVKYSIKAIEEQESK